MRVHLLVAELGILPDLEEKGQWMII
jgi:hypothetical protein